MTLASKRNPIYSSYSDEDIQRMHESADQKRKSLIILIDRLDPNTTDDDLTAIDRTIFSLDDELCARGF